MSGIQSSICQAYSLVYVRHTVYSHNSPSAVCVYIRMVKKLTRSVEPTALNALVEAFLHNDEEVTSHYCNILKSRCGVDWYYA